MQRAVEACSISTFTTFLALCLIAEIVQSGLGLLEVNACDVVHLYRDIWLLNPGFVKQVEFLDRTAVTAFQEHIHRGSSAVFQRDLTLLEYKPQPRITVSDEHRLADDQV